MQTTAVKNVSRDFQFVGRNQEALIVLKACLQRHVERMSHILSVCRHASSVMV